MSEQPEYRPPNFTIQEASQYKADIDSSIALLGRIGAAFAPHEKPAIAEISEVTTIADVAGNLDGTYFTLSSPTTDFYVWFNATDLSGSSDPGLSGATGIQIDYTSDDSAATIAAAMNAAIDALAELNSSVASDIVTISNRDQGSATDIVDIDTGFSFAIITQGGDGPDDLSLYIDEGFILNNPNLSGNNGMDTIASQIISEGSGGIEAPGVNPRIDRVVINPDTGVYELVSGTEAISPTPPDLPPEKIPNCQFRLETSTTILRNSLITDERVAISAFRTTPGRELIESKNVSNFTTEIDFTSFGEHVFFGRYASYEFVLVGVRILGTSKTFGIRISSDGGITFKAGALDYANMKYSEIGASNDSVDDLATSYQILGEVVSASNLGINSTIKLFNFGVDVLVMHCMVSAQDSGGNEISYLSTGQYTGGGLPNAVRFFTSGTYISGHISLYGIVS